MCKVEVPTGLKKCKCCGFSHAPDSMSNEAVEEIRRWKSNAIRKAKGDEGAIKDYLRGLDACIKLLEDKDL